MIGDAAGPGPVHLPWSVPLLSHRLRRCAATQPGLPGFAVVLVSRDLQLHSLWSIPAAAVSADTCSVSQGGVSIRLPPQQLQVHPNMDCKHGLQTRTALRHHGPDHLGLRFQQSWPTPALPAENPYCSCKLNTCSVHHLQSAPLAVVGMAAGVAAIVAFTRVRPTLDSAERRAARAATAAKVSTAPPPPRCRGMCPLARDFQASTSLAVARPAHSPSRCCSQQLRRCVSQAAGGKHGIQQHPSPSDPAPLLLRGGGGELGGSPAEVWGQTCNTCCLSLLPCPVPLLFAAALPHAPAPLPPPSATRLFTLPPKPPKLPRTQNRVFTPMHGGARAAGGLGGGGWAGGRRLRDGGGGWGLLRPLHAAVQVGSARRYSRSPCR